MADTNDITLGVDIDATDAVAKAEKLQNAIEEIFKASEGKQDSPAFQKMLVRLSSLYDDSKKAAKAVTDIGSAPTEAFTELETKIFPIEQNLSKLNEELISTRKRVLELLDTDSAYKNTREFDAITEHIAALQKELVSAKDTLNSYAEGVKQGNADVAESYIEQRKYVQQLRNEIQILTQVRNSMLESGTNKEPTEEYAELSKKLNLVSQQAHKLKTELEELKKEQQALINNGKARTPLDNNADYGDTVKSLQNVNNKTAQLINQLDKELPNAANKAQSALQRAFGSSIVDFMNNINNLPRMIEAALDETAKTLPPVIQLIYSTIKFGAKQIVTAYKEAFNDVSTIIKGGLTKAANVATTAVKKLVSAIASLASNTLLSPLKKLGDSISNIGKQANSSAPSLKQIGRAFLQYGLGARSLYRLINKLRTALFAGFADLALVDEPFNAAMSSIISSLEYLKNAFAAAFAPIIQAVAPALSAFINMVARAVVWLGQLIALLTGQPFKIAIPTFKDYASSTSAGAAAAKKAAKAEKDRAKALKKTAKEMRTIAGFDDVEILKAPDDNDSGSSSPSGGGGGGGGGGLAFQTAPISEGLQKFADMLKKIWETANAYDLGVLFGKKLGELLTAFHEFVPKIQEVANKIAKIIATFLAGFLSVHDTFKMLGVVIADIINLIFTTLNTFLTTFMEYDGFKNLGLDIYYTLVNALHNIDWSEIYNVFYLLGVGIAQTLNEVLTKPDTWVEVFTALTNALRALLWRAYGFVGTLRWGDIGIALAAGINAGIENFPFAMLASTAASFINGIFTFLGNAAANIHWDELGHNIGKSVMDFFDKVNWKENGESLGTFVQGLFDALSGIVEELDFGKITQDIVDFITGFMDKVDWDEDADTVLKLLNGLLDAFLGVVDEVDWENILDNIWKYIQNSPEVEKFLDNIWETIKLIAETKLKFKLASFMTIGGMVIGGILEGMLTPIANGMMWVQTHIVDPIIDWFFNLFGIHSPAETTKPVGEGIINGILEGMLNILASIGSWINEHIFTPIKDGIHNAFGIAGNAAEKIIDVGSSIIEGIKKGAKDTLGAPLSWLQEHVATPIKGGLETAFGIAGGVASKIKEIGSSVINGFKKGAESEKSKLSNETAQINQDVQSKLKAGDWANIGSTAINKMKSGMDSIKSAITSTAKSIQDTVYKTLETADWTKIGSTAITKMKSGMDSIKSAITSVAKTIKDAVYKALETGEWAKIGSNAVTKVKEGMDSIKSAILDTAKDIQSGVYDALGDGDWYDIGDNIIEGIWKGIKDGWDWLESKVHNLAIDLYNAACRALGISSPSKVFAEKVGEMIPAGIGVGIIDNTKSATSSVETMSKSLVDSAKTIKLPPIAMGEVIPSGIANRNNSSQTTLSSLLNVLQSLQSEMITRDELEEILTAMFREHMNIDFHIGDEKLARHVNRGNSILDRRYNPVRS